MRDRSLQLKEKSIDLEKSKKKNMDFLMPLIAGGFLLLGTGLGLWITYNYRQDSKSKQEEIKNLNTEIDKVGKRNEELNKNIYEISNEVKGITTELGVVSEQIKSITQETQTVSKVSKELSDKNLLLAEKTNELSETIKNLQTGGDDSFCHFFWGNVDDHHIGATIENAFDYPQYINEITLVDLNKLENCKQTPPNIAGYISIDFDCFSAARKKISGFELTAKNRIILEELKIPKNEVKGNYILVVNARNGTYKQKVVVSLNTNNGLYLFGNQVSKNGVVLKEPFGTPGFDLSQINWDSFNENKYVFTKK